MFQRSFYIIILLSSLLFLQNKSIAQEQNFEIKGGHFLYNGKPFYIYSGEMHYARIPEQYWRHRLKMLKAMGLNTVATYVFWNHHNIAPGSWDFQTGNRDIKTFLRTAQEEGLFVILRPGPYACAEWEFGGYPWWLLKDSNIVIRTYNKPFLDSCKSYLQKLAEQVKPFLIKNGGPVIMIQAENEFGSYASQQTNIPKEQHRKYNQAIFALLKEAGFDGSFFTSDGSWLFEEGSLPGILPTANGEGNVDNLKKSVNKYHNNEGPYMVAEFYPGWLHHWGEPFPDIATEDVVKQLETYLKNGISFNIYMAHGGTNFGFTAGANYDKEHDIQPDLTTYDYDAPISEAGWVTPKYMAIRELMKKYTTSPIPEIPAPVKVIDLPAIRFTKQAGLFELIEKIKPAATGDPLSMEDLNQPYGYVLYSRKFTQPVKGLLRLNGLRDFAIVYVNKKKVGILNRMYNQYTIPVDIPFNATLDILVENMGRINYGAEIVRNKKGIISPVFIGEHMISGNWKMYALPFDSTPVIKKSSVIGNERPAVFTATFTIQKTGDVFLNMQNWGKGIVFVNGHNLGRYWNIGPQQTLYLPGAFLKKGQNQITVIEQLNNSVDPVIKTVHLPVLKQLKADTHQQLINNK